MDRSRTFELESIWPSDCFASEIKKFRDGEPEAMVRIFKLFEHDLNRYYWYCLGKAELVEDAMQEFYQLMATRLLDSKYRSINLSLYRIWRKEILKKIKKFLRHSSNLESDNPGLELSSGIASENMDRLIRMQLFDCLENLKPTHQKIIALHYLDGYRMNEIPEALNKAQMDVSYENVRQIVVRSLRILRDCLESGGVSNG